jgi:predicted lipoprotein with Yx(FWY)xxD motif
MPPAGFPSAPAASRSRQRLPDHATCFPITPPASRPRHRLPIRATCFPITPPSAPPPRRQTQAVRAAAAPQSPTGCPNRHRPTRKPTAVTTNHTEPGHTSSTFTSYVRVAPPTPRVSCAARTEGISMNVAMRGAGSRNVKRLIALIVLTVSALAAIVATAAAITVSGLSVARRPVPDKSGTIVVDNQGVTVYELGGESLSHLECINWTCFDKWPPLRVSSATARVQKESGVPGTLSIMHRVRGGFYQLMLDRHPLYYY